MEQRTRERRGALFDSRGEGSDVISTSVILLSKSILCLFVFNILSPPIPGVYLYVCLLGGAAEEWGDERLTIRWHVIVWLAPFQLTLWVFDYFRGLQRIKHCFFFYLCAWVCRVEGLKWCIWSKNLSTSSLYILSPATFSVLSIILVVMVRKWIALTWK